MKKVLVTGKKGYIGCKFKEWIKSNNKDIELDYISLRSEAWRDVDFTKYDSILHLAGIAHVSNDKKLTNEYYKINRDLSYEVAKKAKKDQVKHFIFMSSVIVYGDCRNNHGQINKSTVPKPSSDYGKSKLEAENLILQLRDNEFNISIVRPPMVYGKESKGNYNKLSTLAKKTPIFPQIQNKKSMIYIENLCDFIYYILDGKIDGHFHPQNKEIIGTSFLVKEIAKSNKRNILFLDGLNKIINYLSHKYSYINKIFGDLYYEQKMSNYDYEYNKISFSESIKITESRRVTK
ncbi:NAD-dependent epimerase/dehydratase family protein [Exiguobacterium sp. s138]|uniref:NAD-dependent epimerase/dehydratase family protein n=1 Tax=Exiguobacterium sp. s138 TaxID=2751202 RepID=UPI001BED09A1|nr:NAD-dependent epimerase/dehydratase family protein [Exiguobacterium sp. s138]